MHRLLPLLIAASTAACVVPDGARPSVTYAVDAATHYVHRGMVQNETGVLQPSMVTSLPADQNGRIITRAWANVDLSNDTGDAWLPNGHGGRISQYDLNVLYEQTLDNYVLTMGVISYNLPNGTEFPFGERGATLELLAEGTTLLSEKYWSLQPTLAIHWDVDEVQGPYVRGSLTRAFPINEKWSSEVELGLAWMDDDQAFWNYAQSPQTSGLADLTLQSRFFYTVNAHTRVNLLAAYSDVVDSEYASWFDSIGIDETQFWIAAGIQWTY